MKFDPAVGAVERVDARQRLAFAEADDLQALGRYAMALVEIVFHCQCPLLGEALVIGVCARTVGVYPDGCWICFANRSTVQIYCLSMRRVLGQRPRQRPITWVTCGCVSAPIV